MAKAIQDNDWLYNALCPLVKFGTRCHYNSYALRGMEHLPTDGAYIIAPCHQQALMEPLAVLCFAPKPPVFLARADIFRKPTLRAILTFLKIMPVYRIRDGQEQLGRNKEIFDRCRDVLLDGFPLCLMAEGRHNNCHRLLNMGKGMFRIAGETQLQLGDHPLYIVPTGIDFEDYERPYSRVVVNIGKPIAVQPFVECYRENEPVALNQMRDALGAALSPLMVDIRSEAHYDDIMTLCKVLNREYRRREGLRNNAVARFLGRMWISRKMDALVAGEGGEEAARLMKKSEALRNHCRSLRLDESAVAEHWSLAATLLSVLTVAATVGAVWMVPVVRWTLLFGLLCNLVLLLPTHLIVKRKIKDPQFRSSVNWGVRFFSSILYAIVISIVMALCGGTWMSRVADIGPWWGLVAVGLVVIGARVAGLVYNFLRSILVNCQYWMLRLMRRRAMREIDNLYREIEATAL